MTYTPTTEDVRDYYMGDTLECPCDICSQTRDRMSEEFYRWLAEEIRKAKEQAWAEGAKYAHSRNGLGYGYTLDANPYTEES